MGDDTLKAMHPALAEHLLQLIQSGDAKANELNVARQFLKDNGIEDFSPMSPLHQLRVAAGEETRSVPFPTDQEIKNEVL